MEFFKLGRDGREGRMKSNEEQENRNERMVYDNVSFFDPKISEAVCKM
jgi:hypothetical protein